MTRLLKLLIIPLLFLQLLGCTQERTTFDTGRGHDKQVFSTVYYHGSPVKLYTLVPQAYTKKDNEGNVIYESRVARGFLDKRIALLFTYNTAPGFKVGVDLSDYTPSSTPIVFTLIGGETKEEALSRLFGSGKNEPRSHGYIYTIDGKYFHRDPGLGAMEAVSHESINKFKEEKINKRKVLNDYVKNGLIIIEWIPE